ncbi:MAG: aminoacyl-histidine dipeptidase [Ignavibacteriaceae bacterium]
MSAVLEGLKPELIWKHFEAICGIPHPSKHEEKIAQYVKDFGKMHNLETKVDDFGNVVIKKPATKGLENLTPVVLQGHLDMVPEKNNDTEHNFETDPLKIFVDGDWVRAKGTTLGSDNGIGVAAALAVAESTNLKHGPLEFLFTLDEETGMFGAVALKPGFFEADILINLDSEEDGALYIGCAGGKNTYAKFKYTKENVSADSVTLKIVVTGLRGGHSGLDIAAGRGNAIKLLNRALWGLSKEFGTRLAHIEGGSKHNAIPREASAVITVSANKLSGVKEYIANYNSTVKAELATNETKLSVSAVDAETPQNVFDIITQTNLLNALYALPNGVITMSPDIKDLVETSTNLAVITTDSVAVDVVTSQRSSVESEKDDVANMAFSLFSLSGSEVTHGDSYPGWKPNVHSPILKAMKQVYKNKYGNEPEIKAIHAGLECGIINERYPDMDMISFGPTIMGAHSPDEKVQISAVAKFWDLLVAVLENIPAKKAV